MSNYPGFYYYQQPTPCNECIDDHDRWSTLPNCSRCIAASKVKVELLQLSSRVFSHNAFVRRLDTGKIISVPVSSLTYGGTENV